MSRKTLLPTLVVCLLAFGLACDSASPVAPAGTLLSISASPSEITANGTSTIRVTALRANGTPVNPGTVVRFDTTLGSIDEQAEVDDQGVARATLRGQGDIGTATVTARAGSAETATVDVMIGDVASSVNLQATPSQVSDSGGNISLLAVVRDSDGEPLDDATVNFGTEVGRLASGGSLLRTNAQGEARDTLFVDASDLAALNANSFNVTVVVGAGDTTRTDQTTSRNNSCEPIAAFRAEDRGNNQVEVFNDSTGEEPLDFMWDFENDGTFDRFVENPAIYTYDTGGRKEILLRVENRCGADEEIVEETISSGPLP
jgi:PKD repeat protein